MIDDRGMGGGGGGGRGGGGFGGERGRVRLKFKPGQAGLHDNGSPSRFTAMAAETESATESVSCPDATD